MFYRVVTGVVAQRLGDEMVLIHPKTDRIFLLNRTGARVWELLSDQLDLDGTQEKLCQEFGGEPDQIRRDVEQLVFSLTKEQFIDQS
jgi:hypothetical protein